MDAQAATQVREVCALLLRYPDETVLGLLPDIADVVAAAPPDVAAELGQFLDYLGAAEPLEVQRHYVETFDMRRKCSPYLTYWTHGDTRNRGMALLHFKQVYHHAGMSIGDAELPDHLSVVLEFASVGDAELGSALLAEHRGVVGLLHAGLEAVESPYAHVVAAVLSTTEHLTAEDELLMQRLAVSGPPTESVGMAGPIDLTLTPFGVGASDLSMGARR